MIGKILIVDDDIVMRRSLAFNLEQSGFQTWTAERAEDAIAKIPVNQPDLVLLDIGLPGMDGLRAIREIRKERNIPVIFLTARRTGNDQVEGLDAGADDYITKPFDFDVLLAHVRAVLRRHYSPNAEPEDPVLRAGDLVIDLPQRAAEMSGRRLELSPKEFELLSALALEPDKVISTDKLLRRVWGAEHSGDNQVLYVHIRWLRNKIEPNPDKPVYIITARGVGYKFVSHPESLA